MGRLNPQESMRKKMNLKKYLTPEFGKKLIIVLVSVLCMGFFLSFLIDVDLGTDPCTL